MTEATHKPDAPRISRAEAKAERRLQLIEATVDCIARFGLSGTTMARVTELAGVSVGLANFHFDSKDRLFEAVLKHLADEQRALWQSRVQGPERSGRDLLQAIVESRFHPTICARRKLAVWFAFWGERRFRPTYRRICAERDRSYDDMVRLICARLCEEGGYPDVEPAVVADGLSALTDGLWLDLLVRPESMSRERARRITLSYLADVFPRHFDQPAAEGKN